MAFRFLHCSDIHLLSLRGTEIGDFLNKRMTGGLNLLLGRRRKHDDALFVEMMRQARELAVDRVVITGDLTNLALDAEFIWVKEHLQAAQLPFFVIPGNHDAYVAETVETQRFAVHLGFAHAGSGSMTYPMVLQQKECALIGLSSAIPTEWFCAAGELGDAQLRRLATILAEFGQAGMTRIVLVHHPITAEFDHRRRGLRDAPALREVLAQHGAELVLHGHEHRTFIGEVAGNKAPVPVHAIASGTSLSHAEERRAAFAIYTVEAGKITRDLHVWRDGSFVAAA